ncbi:MAG: hypothetical protein U0Y82_11785 [Thermoleophilia bacterium]
MDARSMKAYAVALTGLSLTGAWLGVASDVFPHTTHHMTAAEKHAAKVAKLRAAHVRRDLALAHKYQLTAHNVSLDTVKLAKKMAARPPVVQVVYRGGGTVYSGGGGTSYASGGGGGGSVSVAPAPVSVSSSAPAASTGSS